MSADAPTAASATVTEGAYELPTSEVVRSFAIAYGTVALAGLVAYGVARLIGATDLIAGVIGGSFLTFVKSLQERIERAMRRRANVAMPTSSPTVTLPRMLFYAPAIVMGSYLAVILAAIGVAAALLASEFGTAYAASAYMVTSLAGGTALPMALYLVGEWIGRRTGRLLSSLLVAAVSPTLLALAFWIAMRLAVSGPSPLPSETGPTAAMIWLMIHDWAPSVVAGMVIFTVAIPVLLGAYRGSVYKRYFDLAFFSRRAGSSTRREIDEFVDMVATQYGSSSG